MNSLKISGKEFIFSRYMSHVEQEDIDHYNDEFSRDELIAACGVDPKDNQLVVVSFSGDVRLVKPTGSLIPSHATIALFGRAIKITFKDNLEFMIDSKTLLSETAGQEIESQLYVNNNYLCELHAHNSK